MNCINNFRASVDEKIRSGDISDAYGEFVLPNRPSDREMRIYGLIGVPVFRRFITNTIGRLGGTANYYIGMPTTQNLQRFAVETVKNESAHTPHIYSTLVVSSALSLSGHPIFGAITLGLSALHGFPSMLQRYNRRKIIDFLERD